jgi:hypothetical protein
MYQKYGLQIGLALLVGLLISPAAAFTMNSVDIAIDQNGDADITASYSLSWIERAVVFMRIAHPENELEKALEQYSGKDVQVTSVDSGMTALTVDGFAAVTESPTAITYTTPMLDFSGAETAIKGYWFSRFVTVDASPDVAVVRFADGYQETFSNTYVIPRIVHEVAK